MDSDGGPHLCSQWKQSKIQQMINSPERLKSRRHTPSFDECARKDGCYEYIFFVGGLLFCLNGSVCMDDGPNCGHNQMNKDGYPTPFMADRAT